MTAYRGKAAPAMGTAFRTPCTWVCLVAREARCRACLDDAIQLDEAAAGGEMRMPCGL
jgi:hypothetical protein